MQQSFAAFGARAGSAYEQTLCSLFLKTVAKAAELLYDKNRIFPYIFYKKKSISDIPLRHISLPHIQKIKL